MYAILHSMKLFGIAILIGIINGALFVIFELLVKQGTNLIWNDIFHTNTLRFLVIPLAIVLSIVYSVVVRSLKENRLRKNTPLSEELNSKIIGTPRAILTTLIVGLTSLLSGASLGPEAPLFSGSAQTGAWVSKLTNENEKTTKVLVLSSVGALLVAFFGSLGLVLFPLLLLLKEKKLTLKNGAIVVLAGLFAFGTLFLLKGNTQGFGTVPVEFTTYVSYDFITAFVFAFIGVFLGVALYLFIDKIYLINKQYEKKIHWVVKAGIYGLILGVLYFLGGQIIQFSGSEGIQMLFESKATLTTTMLIVIVLSKFLATAWSGGSGYRGGLVFPSIFMGVALAFLVVHLFPFFQGMQGPVIGMWGGFISGVMSPAMGFILLLALLPPTLYPIVIVAFLGAFLGKKILTQRTKKKSGVENKG